MLARPATEEIIFQDNSAAVKEAVSSTTLPPFPTLPRLSLKPEELNALMLEDVNPGGYVYNRPDTPFDESQDKFAGYVYDRPKNPMTLPTSTSTTVSTPTTEEEIIDLPDGVARILR